MQSSGGGGVPGESPFGVSPGSDAGGYCTACGTPYGQGQTFCGRCGSRLIVSVQTDGISGAATSTSFGSGSAAADPDPQLAGLVADDPTYGTWATVGAMLMSIFLPFIALIVAIGLRSQERLPRRRQFLKNWAIGSAIWLCTGWLIPIIAFSAASSGVSGCQGGIDQLVPPSYQSSDDVHWQATYTCMNGGTETKPVPSSQVPGG